jgi:hypothetical protein
MIAQVELARGTMAAMGDAKPTLDYAGPDPAGSEPSIHFKPIPTQGPVLRWVQMVSLLLVLAGVSLLAYMVWFVKELGPMGP